MNFFTTKVSNKKSPHNPKTHAKNSVFSGFCINLFRFLRFHIIFTVLTLVVKWCQNPKTQKY